MRSAHTTRRSIAQRARRDAEGELRPPSPQYPPHGEEVGRITLSLYGHEVTARLLSTGHHCRSYGVEIGGRVVGVMGAYEAWRLHISPAVARMMSLRHLQC